MRPRHFLSAFLVFAIGLAAASAAHAERPERRAILTVTGSGEVSAVPDQARIGAGVVREAPSAGAALAANSQALGNVLAALRQAGIEDRDIRTRQVSLSPVYDPKPTRGQPRAIVAYRASNQLSIRARKLEDLGALMDALVVAGATNLNGPHFMHGEPRPLRDEARRRAVADARDKAALYAEAAGVELVRVLRIDEGAVSAPRPQRMMAVRLEAADAGRAPVPIAAGEDTIAASVTLVWEIR